MPCKDCHISVKVLRDLPGYKAGQTVKVQANNGIPISKFWRDRIKDSVNDNCVEVVKIKKSTIKKPAGEK